MTEPLSLGALVQGGWATLDFVPFKPGVAIHWIRQGEPAIALLRYEPGARVALHLHPDVETILVLEGAQSDEHGTYTAGDYVVNPPGSQHSVHSETGCVVLLHWSKPVQFL